MVRLWWSDDTYEFPAGESFWKNKPEQVTGAPEGSGIFADSHRQLVLSVNGHEKEEPDCCCSNCDFMTFGCTWLWDICCDPWKDSRVQYFELSRGSSQDYLMASESFVSHHKWPWLCGWKAYKSTPTDASDVSYDSELYELSFRVNAQLSSRITDIQTVRRGNDGKFSLEHHLAHRNLTEGPRQMLMEETVDAFSERVVQAFDDLKAGNYDDLQDIRAFHASDESKNLQDKAVRWRAAPRTDIYSLIQSHGEQAGGKVFIMTETPDDLCVDDCITISMGVICGATYICLPLACDLCIKPAFLRVFRIFRFVASDSGTGVELEILETPRCSCCNIFRVSGPFRSRMRGGIGVKGALAVKGEGGKECVIIYTNHHGSVFVQGQKGNNGADDLVAFLSKFGCKGIPGMEPEDPSTLKVETEVLESTTLHAYNDIGQALQYPRYWTYGAMQMSKFDQMFYVSRDKHWIFDDFFKKTYFAKVTQDRPCPKGTCPKTPGGCPCNKVGGFPGLPTRYCVRRVIRVEDSEMWRRYDLACKSIREKRPHLAKFEQPLVSNQCAAQYREHFSQLDTDINEVYVWHGTSVRAALSIAQGDFQIDLSGSNVGTMYGKGAYLAESCTKADEYSKTDSPGGYYEGVYALLLCRACMGRYFYTTDRDESAQDKVVTGEFDSTLGDRLKSANTFRELVIYNNDQIYPEYIVLYERVYKKDDPKEVEKRQVVPFHTELPVYWKNVHRDPSNDPFEYQVHAAKRTLQLLQKVVKLTCQGKVPKVVSARRIEHAKLWCSYVQYKMTLKDRLEESILKGECEKGRFETAEELDGDESAGHVKTTEVLKELDSEDSISLDNLESSLNEHMLWHGSSKDAVESIVRTDFQVATGGEIKHGMRFGTGAYFAELLDKSLCYAPEDSNGNRWVLLCRVTCGKQYYVTKVQETDAHANCIREGKDSVLANPENKGPREFIVLGAQCAYPEFCLELDMNADPDDAWT